MASLRDVRRKIGTVKNINKITQAMKMVAAARLRKAQERVDAARPYADKMRELIAQVAPHVPREVVDRHTLLQTRESDRIGVVVMTSDRGLAGSYNNNIIRLAQGFLREQQAAGRTVELITVGRKADSGLRNRGFSPVRYFPMLGVDAPFTDVQAITRAVVELYTRSEDPVGEVYIVYTEFKNAVTQIPHVDRFLPIETAAVASEGEAPVADIEFEYEPSAGALLDVLIPRFVDNQVYQYLLESIASEYGARMTAMSTASDNARDMISSLTIAYNRARQDAITKELLDIVGGAEALSGE